MNKSLDVISNPYSGSPGGQPYISRQDLFNEKRRIQREMELRRLREPTIKQLSNTMQPPQQKHVTINDTASVATYDFNPPPPDHNQSMVYQHTPLDNDYEFNEREEVSETGSMQPQKLFQTPQQQMAAGKATPGMKQYNERTRGRSSMIYATPQPNKSLKSPNPLLGESEGDYKRKLIQDEYKNQARKEMEFNKERSTSKRRSRHMEKIREASSKSPKNEPNIYAMKQRYKFSYFNQGQNADEPIAYSQSEKYYQSVPRVQSNGYTNLLQHHKDYEGEESGTGYILKTDPMQILINKEIQKQRYAKDLRQQMEEDSQKKRDQKLKNKLYDEYIEDKIKRQLQQEGGSREPYRFKTTGGGGAPLRDEKDSPDPQNKNALFDGYERQLIVREKQKEEWRDQLIQQMNEQSRAKHEQKLKRKLEDELDDERVYRQLREINSEFGGAKLPRTAFSKRDSPHLANPQFKKNEIDLVIQNNKQNSIRETMKSQITGRNESHVSFESPSKPMVTYESQVDRDFEMERQIRNLKLEASQTQIDTGRAIDRLNQLQSEIYLKQKQNQLHSAEFFNDMMNQSKILLTGLKYTQPYDQLQFQSRSSLSYVSPLQHRVPDTLTGVQTEFQILPSGFQKETRVEQPAAQKEMTRLMNQNNSITDELDEILHRFQYQ